VKHISFNEQHVGVARPKKKHAKSALRAEGLAHTDDGTL
jgi:hypothetical protein